MSCTRIFLDRQGATIMTAEDRFAGSTDVPLSDEGRQQARGLAHDEIVAAHSSTLCRTIETASIISQPHG